MKEKVLVTGAAGFVGANLVRGLLKENKYEIHILTRKNTNLWRLKDIYSNIIDHKVDILDRERLLEIIKEINPKKICHLAIYGGYPFQKDDKKIIDTNFTGTINLLDALNTIDYDCFINTGSSSEYGEKKEPMKESDVCEPNTVYGVAKTASTMYCNYIANSENKNIGTLRLFSIYGDYEEKGRLVTTLFTDLINQKDVKLGNPNAVRDFVYVEDVVNAYKLILENPQKLKGKIYNICSNKQTSVKEMAEKIKLISHSEKKLNFSTLAGRSFDTKVWVGNNNLFRKDYGWKPLSLEEGLKKASQWFKENIDLYEEEN